MASTSAREEDTGEGSIQDSTAYYLEISSVSTAKKFVESLKRNAHTAKLVKAINIIDVDFDTEIGAEYLAQESLPPPDDQDLDNKDRDIAFSRMVTHILDIISDAGSTLTKFYWQDKNTHGHNPEFLPTLFKNHSRTLQELALAFAPGEVNTATVPPETTFPKLRYLYIDANLAEGDSPSLIYKILTYSPVLNDLEISFDDPESEHYKDIRRGIVTVLGTTDP